MKKHILLALLLALGSLAARAITVSAEKSVEIALANSEEMMAADNAVEQARLNRSVAFTAYLPNFAGSVTGGWRLPDYKDPDMGLNLRMRGMYMAGINLQQPIFAGGKIVAANRLARIGSEAAAQQQRQVRISVSANAETSYWTYVAILAKVEMMKSYAALVDTAYTQTRAALDAGMATRNDLLRIEARRSQVRYQQEQVTSGADLCRMALCNAMGLPLDTEIEVADTGVPAEIPADLGIYNLSDRPEMQLLQADIEAKQQQVRMTRADFLPTAGLQAGWSAYGGIDMSMMTAGPDGNYYPMNNKIKGTGWSIMLSLQVPLFHWGEGVKKVKHARLEVENARLNLAHNTRQLDLQVQQAITNVRTGAELVRSAEAALEQASAALESTSAGYSLGLNSITALLDAQSQWHTSRANLIEARTQLRIHIIDYRAATATL